MSYRPTHLTLLKGFRKFLNFKEFKHDYNFSSEYTVQSNFSSPWFNKNVVHTFEFLIICIFLQEPRAKFPTS